MNKKLKVMNIIEQFEIMYPYAECSLDYQDPIQLMVATQLAAQCTDVRVNIVTKELFKKYKSVDDYANANLQEFEQDIRSTGFYHNKARNIIAACRMIIDVFDRNVPSDMDSLLMLPGVGRKTANLILNDWFGVPGVVVDTHAKRLANRIGLTKNSDPDKIEYDLMKIIPIEKWGRFCHQLVFHGRAICTARKPMCEKCGIVPFCKFGSANT